jgi:hypothetical protein
MKKIVLLLIIITGFLNKACCQTDDESAIKQLLEKESATWRAGDIKAHADCWIIQPYSKILFSSAAGAMVDVPPDMMINPPADMVGKGGSSANTNYKMNISGNNAWVSHDEVSIAKDGAKTYSSEFRILEKINGKWKLVAQSIHSYNPK